MPYALDDLGQAVLHQLYDVVCGCERSVPPRSASFLTWCRPGIPFRSDEFGFATGDVDAGSVESAYAFSRLVDFVPDAGAAYTGERQLRAFSPDGSGRLSGVYGDVLRSARVVHGGLTDEERRKVERLGGLLRTTRVVLDTATGEPRRITEHGAILRAYNERLAAYLAAVLRYRHAARSGAALDRTQVESGLAAWDAVGYRNEVHQIDAYIDQVSGRDLVPWRRALVDMLDNAVVTAGSPCRRFHHTTPVPAAFATGDGWTTHSFDHRAVDGGAHRQSRDWRAGGRQPFTLTVDGAVVPLPDVRSFELRLELCPVLISRPWFYPPLLSNRGWTWNHQLSDGGDPPAGRLIGYPATILFARDLRIESPELARAYRRYAGRAISLGPFWLGGHHPARDRSYPAEPDATGLTVPGMQILAFINHQLGKTPNPAPELDQGRFV